MLKVLLVDDEPFIIQGLKVIIDWENEEFEIAGTASNGKEALQFLENENVDLVIADIRMPEMTGLELLETLRKDKKSDVYFVILSGYADFSYAQQAMQNDCTDYILKPVDKEMLLKVLSKVLVLKNEKNNDRCIVHKHAPYITACLKHIYIKITAIQRDLLPVYGVAYFSNLLQCLKWFVDSTVSPI